MSTTETPTIGGPELAAMDAPQPATTATPPSAREVELAHMAETNPGVYRWSEGGKLAAEHLKLKQERESASKGEAVATKAPVADDAPDGETADADEAETAPTAEADAEPLEVSLEIPESAEEYLEAMDEAHWSRQDPQAEKYAQFLADAGMPQAAYDAGIRYIERIRDERLAADKTDREAAKARLKPDEMRTITATLRDAGDFGALLKTARGPDGSLIITNPAFKGILNLTSKTPSAGAPSQSADESRLVELQRIMNANVGRLQERTGRRLPSGDWETLGDEMLSVRRRLDARKRA